MVNWSQRYPWEVLAAGAQRREDRRADAVAVGGGGGEKTGGDLASSHPVREQTFEFSFPRTRTALSLSV